jgi:hypothetical protein
VADVDVDAEDSEEANAEPPCAAAVDKEEEDKNTEDNDRGRGGSTPVVQARTTGIEPAMIHRNNANGGPRRTIIVVCWLEVDICG